jgi:hypothetical protein
VAKTYEHLSAAIELALERANLRFECLKLHGPAGVVAFDQAVAEGAKPLAPRILEILNG